VTWQAGEIKDVVFIFTGNKGAIPPVIYVNQNQGIITAQRNPDAKPNYSDLPLDLQELRHGPASVASVIVNQMDDVESLLLTLTNDGCELTWHVKGLRQGGDNLASRQFDGSLSDLSGQFSLDK
jgi:hypothetical protein